jgi:hypothetical protein
MQNKTIVSFITLALDCTYILYNDKNSAWSVNDGTKKFYRVGPWRDGCDEVFAQVHFVQTLDVAEGIN